MSDTTFTPGPWDVWMDGALICVGAGYKAAPEMYALLEGVIEACNLQDDWEITDAVFAVHEKWLALRAKINEVRDTKPEMKA